MIVHAQPGYAVDWSWSDELTVWATASDSADRLVTTHRLGRAPRSERQAAVAAARWWRGEGRAAVAAVDRPAQDHEEEEVVR